MSQRWSLSLEPIWLENRQHPAGGWAWHRYLAAGTRLGMAWSEGLITQLLLDVSCAHPSMPTAYWVSAQLDPSFHRERWSPGNCLLGQGFTYCTLFSVPLRFEHRIGHFPLSTLPPVRPQVKSLMCQHSAFIQGTQSTEVLGTPLQQPHRPLHPSRMLAALSPLWYPAFSGCRMFPGV